MRICLLVLLTSALLSCSTHQGIQKIVDRHVKTFPLSQLSMAMPEGGGDSTVKIENGFGLPPKTEVVLKRTSVLPLIFYCHYLKTYEVTLGQDLLDEPWYNYLNQRLGLLASEFSANGIRLSKIEVTKAVAHGAYVSGYAILAGYYAGTGADISQSKDVSAEISLTISWLDNDGNEQTDLASSLIQIDKRGVYSGLIRTLTGKTVNLTQDDINFHFKHEIFCHPPVLDKELNLTSHLFRMCDLLVLSLDELCAVQLSEIKGQELVQKSPSLKERQLHAKNLIWERINGNKLGIRFTKGYLNSGGIRYGLYHDFFSSKSKMKIDLGDERRMFSVDQYLSERRIADFRHFYFTMEDVEKNPDKALSSIKEP